MCLFILQRQGLFQEIETNHVNHPADEDCQTAAEEGCGICRRQGVNAVDNRYAGQENRRISVADGVGNLFFFQDRFQCEGAEDVGNNIRHDGQVCQEFELFGQRRADGHQGQAALHSQDEDHAFDRNVGVGDLGEYLREQAPLGAGLKDAGQGKLPRQERAGAGEDHQAHDDLAGRRAEHVRKGQAEGGAGAQDFRIGNDAGNDVRRGDIDKRYAQGADEGCDGNGTLRIFYGVHVDGSRFQTQERPEGQGDGIADGVDEPDVVRIPGRNPRRRIKPVPADEGDAQNGDNCAPDRYRTELARIAGAAEI